MTLNVYLDGKLELEPTLYKRFKLFLSDGMTAQKNNQKYHAVFWSGCPGSIFNGRFVSEPYLSISFVQGDGLLCKLSCLVGNPLENDEFSLILNGTDHKIIDYKKKKEFRNVSVDASSIAKKSLDDFVKQWRATYIN